MKNVLIAVMLLLGFQPAFAQPRCDSSFRFQHSDNSRVEINTMAAGFNFKDLYDSAVGFTWEAWVYLHDTNYSSTIFIATEDPVPFEDIYIGMGWSGSPAKLSFLLSKNASMTTVSVHGSTKLMPLTWYYIAAVCDYTANTISLYLNGALIGTTTIPWGAADRLSRNIATSLGNFNTEDSHNFNGLIDEVKFWKGVRTPADILNDSAGCVTLPQPNLVAYFKAKEGTGYFAASSVDTGFRAVNYVHWGTNAPVAVCESCCPESTSPKANITTPSLTICDTATDSVTIVVKMAHLTPGAAWTATLSDGSVASGIASASGDDSAVIKVLPSGTTTYSVSTSSISSNPCAMVAGSMTITVIPCHGNGNPAAVAEYGTARNCRVYPNPGSGMFTVSLGQSKDAQLYTVVDVNGQIIKRSEIKGNTFSFDISNVAAGVYNVIVIGQHDVITKRVVVTK